MKKLFAIVALTLALGGFALPAETASALDNTGADAGSSGGRATSVVQATINNGGTAEQASAAIDRTTAIEQRGIDEALNAGRECIGSPLKCLLGGTGNVILGAGIFILEVLLRLISWVLWVVGILFNIVVRELVVEMGKYVTSTSAVGIRAAWTIMRDLANIGIIGGLIAVAVGTILHLQNVNAKTYLVRLIIAALLINFSYFFAGAIIDASNFLATSIYKTVISTDSCKNNSVGASWGSVVTTLGGPPSGQNDHCTITDKFMSLVNLPGLRAGDAPKSLGEASDLGGSAPTSLLNLFFYDAMLLVLELVTIFVFLSAIFLLLGRFVALILILISSPLGVVGVAIPKISVYAKKWWEALFSQALFAPIYFLLVGISLSIVANSKGAILNATGADKGFTAVIGIILTFIVATVFMLQSLKIAKQLSERTKELGDVYKGAGFVTKYGLNYPLAVGARNTIGRGAEWLGNRYREFAGRHEAIMTLPFINGIDRAIKSGLEKTKDAKFGGFDSFDKVKKEKLAREVELGEVKREEDILEKLRGNLSGKERKDFDKLLAKNRNRGSSPLDKKEQAELERLAKKGGAAGGLRLAESDFWREFSLGKKEFLKDKNRYETDEEFAKRQESRGELGIKKDEDLTQYYDRLEKQSKDGKDSYRDARGRAEALVASLPAGTIERKIAENSNRLLDFIPVLSSEDFMEQMKNPNIKRKIKSQATVMKNGEWAKMISDINRRVEDGQIIEGSDEYNKLTAVAFRHAQKVIRNKDVFLHTIKSGAVFNEETGEKFEDLRSMRALYDGSTTGMYLHAKDHFGTTESRAMARLKRGYLHDQRKKDGASIILGREAGEDSYYLPHVGGADSYYADQEAISEAKKVSAASNKIIQRYEQEVKNGGSGISDSTYREAQRNKRYADLVLRENEKGKIDSTLYALTNEEERRKELDAAGKRLSEYIDERGNLRPGKSEEDLHQLLMNDDAALLKYESDRTDRRLGGAVRGKSDEETAAYMSDERSYSPSFIKELSAAQIGGIFRNKDNRFKHAARRTFLVEHSDADIQDFIENEHLRQALDGWPTKEEIDEINKLRAEQGRSQLPYNPFGDDEQTPPPSRPGGGSGSSPSGGGTPPTPTRGPTSTPSGPSVTNTAPRPYPTGGGESDTNPVTTSATTYEPEEKPEEVSSIAEPAEQPQRTVEEIEDGSTVLSDSKIQEMRSTVGRMTSDQIRSIPREYISNPNFLAALNRSQLNTVLNQWGGPQADLDIQQRVLKNMETLAQTNKLDGEPKAEWLLWKNNNEKPKI